jgi:hypothetical protein
VPAIGSDFLPSAIVKFFKMTVFVLPIHPGVWSRSTSIVYNLGRGLFFGSAPEQSKDKKSKR